jgi:hypothetical protein
MLPNGQLQKQKIKKGVTIDKIKKSERDKFIL